MSSEDNTPKKTASKAPLKVKCPICSKVAIWADNPFRPFCSERCRNIDLGNWADGSYSVESTDAPSAENLEKPQVQDEEL